MKYEEQASTTPHEFHINLLSLYVVVVRMLQVNAYGRHSLLSSCERLLYFNSYFIFFFLLFGIQIIYARHKNAFAITSFDAIIRNEADSHRVCLRLIHSLFFDTTTCILNEHETFKSFKTDPFITRIECSWSSIYGGRSMLLW